MKPIEPGCLAIIVSASNKENIGKTVRCLQQISVGYLFVFDCGYKVTIKDGLFKAPWLVEATSSTLTVGDIFTTQNSSCVAEKSWLMRIGDDSVQDVLKKVIENVE